LYDDGENDEWELFKANMRGLLKLAGHGLVKAAYPAGAGGAGAALALMAFGNMTGIEADAGVLELIGEKNYSGAVLVELDGEAINKAGGEALLGETLQKPVWKWAGRTIAEPVFRITGNTYKRNAISSASVPLEELRNIFESPLALVYPQKAERAGQAAGEDSAAQPAPEYSAKPQNGEDCEIKKINSHSAFYKSLAHPLVVIPVFPGTNCEWDMARAFREAGARTRELVFRNRSAGDIAASIEELKAAIDGAQIIALSGGFSAGDEPDGSGKFIANVFRSPTVAGAVREFLEKRGGLMLGICNGFQALIKLGLVPYGGYTEQEEHSPTLTFNRIGRHVSRMARTVVMPSASPWLALEEPGTVHIVPVSHGEGRVSISAAEAEKLFKAGQVPFCYSDEQGRPALSEPDNPNGSDYAIEALASPDGRILGKMGHSERRGRYVHINIPGNKNQRIFEAGVKYFL
jgi:phosphoribosylformylglycinamidine synthase